tara:strand:- start:306 stop:551 length:246 start_codon:yes stop_codon:yes gene_type:complete
MITTLTYTPLDGSDSVSINVSGDLDARTIISLAGTANIIPRWPRSKDYACRKVDGQYIHYNVISVDDVDVVLVISVQADNN